MHYHYHYYFCYVSQAYFPPLSVFTHAAKTQSIHLPSQSQFTLSYAIVFGHSCNQRCKYKLKDFSQKSHYTFNFSSIIWHTKVPPSSAEYVSTVAVAYS